MDLQALHFLKGQKYGVGGHGYGRFKIECFIPVALNIVKPSGRC